MADIGFKTADTLAVWQWLVLGGFCSLLIAVAVVAKRFSAKIGQKTATDRDAQQIKQGQHKPVSQGLMGWLSAHVGADQHPEIPFRQTQLSRQATLYQLTVNGHQYTIFETDNGLIQLTEPGLNPTTAPLEQPLSQPNALNIKSGKQTS